MPKEIWPDDFHCSICGKVVSGNAILMPRKYSVCALRLPYFLCGDCRICSYSKLLIRQTISRWRNSGTYAKTVPYKKIYLESIEELEKTLAYYMRTAGYRPGRFKQKKK